MTQLARKALKEAALKAKAAYATYEANDTIKNYSATEAADIALVESSSLHEIVLSLLASLEEAEAVIEVTKDSLWDAEREMDRARSRAEAAEERADKVEAENAQLKLTASWAKSFGAAHDMMQDALKAISHHADNQNIGHIDYRMHAKQQADHTLEACAGSPGLLDPASTPKPDWTDGQWKWADEERAALSEEA